MSTPAGWYSDPSSVPGALRWWDGERWTDQVSSTALPPPPATARVALTREIDVGRLARAAAIATAVAMPIQLVISAFVLSELADFLHDAFSAGHAVTPSLRINPMLSLASNLTSITVFVALVVTLVWVHASATTAARLGIPATRSPAWAVGGFLIPVVNLWWPYQSVRDLFPAGHPARQVVGRWWAQHLGATFTPLIALGVAFASVPAAVVVGAGSAVLYVGAAIALRRVITMAASTHTDLLDLP